MENEINLLNRELVANGIRIARSTEHPEEPMLSWADHMEMSRRVMRVERRKAKAYLNFLYCRSGRSCDLCAFSMKEILVPHHIRFLQHGGETDTHNLVAVCPTCHALIHYFARRRFTDLEGRLCRLGELDFSLAKAERLLAIATEHVSIRDDGTVVDRAFRYPSEKRGFQNQLTQLGVPVMKPMEK